MNGKRPVIDGWGVRSFNEISDVLPASPSSAMPAVEGSAMDIWFAVMTLGNMNWDVAAE